MEYGIMDEKDKDRDQQILDDRYAEYEKRQKKIRRQQKQKREQDEWEEMIDELPEDVQAIMKKVK